MNKLNYLVLLAIILSTNAFATDYEDSAAEVSFHVSGNMVNQAMEQVNFLICWMEKTNPQNYVGAGSYLALVDQAKCQNQTGADATAEAAASKPSSANQSSSADNEKVEAETVKYSETLMNVTQDGVTQVGKGWAKPVFDGGPMNGMEPVAYISLLQTAGVDEAAGKPFGDFEFWWDMVQPEAFSMQGRPGEPPMQIPAGSSIDTGYIKALGRNISYLSNSMQGGSSALFSSFLDNGDVEGVFTTAGAWESSGQFQPLDFMFQFKVDSTGKAYCQKFLKAQAYTFSEDMSVAPTKVDVTESQLIAAGAEKVFIDAGGAFSNITGENCFHTASDKAMKHVWRYGTYNKTTGARYDLTNSSFSIIADATTNSLSQDVYGWAAYWGTDYDKYSLADTDVINENTIWKNESDSSDTKEYKIRANYVEVIKKSTEFMTLAQLDGYRASVYLNDNEAYWTTQLGLLGDGAGADSGFGDFEGNCTAAGKCQEYEGEFTYDATTPTASYFTFTHGMDWNKMGDPRVELTVPKKFTLAQWDAVMKKGYDWDDDGVDDEIHYRSLGFWSNDVQQYFDLPSALIKNPASTDQASKVRTAKQEKVDLSTLANKSFICIERCLSTTSMNTVLQTALNQASQNNKTLIAQSPYYPIGDYFQADGYIDWNENGVQDEFESAVKKGDSWGLGVVATDAKTYTVSAAGVLLDPEGVALTWSSATRTGLASAAAASSGGRADELLRGQTANTKPAGFENNWSTNLDWALSGGQLIENTASAIAELECSRVAAGREYTNNYPGMTNDGLTGVKRYCPDAFWSGRVTTSYEVNIKTGESFELTTGGIAVAMDRPKKFEITVPAGITDPAGKSLAGKTYRLHYEGFGELHGIPGTIINQCTGEELGDVFIMEWSNCYRYISDFTIPDGTELVDVADDTNVIITRALNGDEFLKGAPELKGTFTYQYTAANLPTDSVLKQTATPESDDYIGAPPTTGIINNGDAAVVNGDTKFTPPAP